MTITVYYMSRLNTSGCIIVNVVIHEKKIQRCKGRITVKTWNLRSMTIRKLKNLNNKMKLVQMDILGICELR